MALPEIENLKRMASEIENGIVECQTDLRKVGTLNIKVQSFRNMLSKQDPSSEEVRMLSTKASDFQNKTRMLSDQRRKEKQGLEQEMIDSKIKFKKITEASDNSGLHDSDFYSKQSSRLDDYISSSMDSLEALKKQSVYIDRINNTIKSGLLKLGVGSDVLHKIESRFAGDKSLFLILVAVIVILIFILKIVF